MRTSPRLWDSGNSCGPFDTSKRRCCLDEMCRFTRTSNTESGTNPLGSILQSSYSLFDVLQGKQETWSFHHAAAAHRHLHTSPHHQDHGLTWSLSNTKEVACGFKVCPQCSHWMTGPFDRTSLRQAQQFRPSPAPTDDFGVLFLPVFLWW